jgi:hypothetical protein
VEILALGAVSKHAVGKQGRTARVPEHVEDHDTFVSCGAWQDRKSADGRGEGERGVTEKESCYVCGTKHRVKDGLCERCKEAEMRDELTEQEKEEYYGDVKAHVEREREVGGDDTD